MKCEYCGTDEQNGTKCEKCGAPLPEPKKDKWKSDPFFYNGYIVYHLRDYSTDTIEVQFWLGMQLIERLKFSMEFIRQFWTGGTDFMPDVWELFLVAHGEKEVIEWQEKNNILPAVLKITRVEHPDREYYRSLDHRDLLKAIQL